MCLAVLNCSLNSWKSKCYHHTAKNIRQQGKRLLAGWRRVTRRPPAGFQVAVLAAPIQISALQKNGSKYGGGILYQCNAPPHRAAGAEMAVMHGQAACGRAGWLAGWHSVDSFRFNSNLRLTLRHGSASSLERWFFSLSLITAQVR